MCKRFQNQNQFYWKGVKKFNIKIKILEILKQSQHQNQDKNSWKIIIIQYQNQDSWELNQSKSRFIKNNIKVSMGVQHVILGWCIDSTGPFQNQESKSILIMQCFKINIQYQEWHSIFQYQESISILEDWMSKSISKI